MKNPKSLNELGNILIALHRQGFTAAYDYSFAERDDQFGKGSITVNAVALPPKSYVALEDRRTDTVMSRFFRRILSGKE